MKHFKNKMSVESKNFKFLEEKLPELAILVDFAEQYLYSDPSSSLVKLRSFVERSVHVIYREIGLREQDNANLIDLMRDEQFAKLVSPALLSKMHAIRMEGNKAAHAKSNSSESAKWLLKEAHDVSKWIYLSFCKGKLDELKPFELPKVSNKESQKSELVKKEIQIQKLLEEIEQKKKDDFKKIREKQELDAIATRTREVTNELNYNEEQTRYNLIDNMLRNAGWTVNADKKDSDDVKQELSINHQPTSSGEGFADYVLWDADADKPLAVIEAKKTAIGAEQGKTQAKIYADGLEKDYDVRPVIIYTNGYDIYVWDDAPRSGSDSGYPSRKIYGYYDKDSLKRMIAKRNSSPFCDTSTNPGKPPLRDYQIEGIQRLKETFDNKNRRGLLVQATGTGKTRVATSFSDVLFRANQGKRILFLCDRRELRKQANNAYKTHLNDYPRLILSAKTAQDKNKRIYFATYQAMAKSHEKYNIGFFDLIIIDEAHRSIYFRYKYMIDYFDALVVGLTATPVQSIVKNTFEFFECSDGVPTHWYDYQEAIDHEPPYLAHFNVETVMTKFLEDGIKYSQMTEDEKQQVELFNQFPEHIEFERRQMDSDVLNEPTSEMIMKNLMENGLRSSGGDNLGKTIVFARNHEHAKMLHKVFDKLYPQYGGKYCQIIDNYDPRAEQLIDDFKGIGTNKELTIAISVDMLDTGIDVPEILNLVFAKPIYSYVKFWQMIGRGTRLCDKINKKSFMIFDHWWNFGRFDEDYKEREVGKIKSSKEKTFTKRIEILEHSLKHSFSEEIEIMDSLIKEDLKTLPENAIPVKEKWKELLELKKLENVPFESPEYSTHKIPLLYEVADLMQWIVDEDGGSKALMFDNVVTSVEKAYLQKSDLFDDLKDKLIHIVKKLKRLEHLGDVSKKIETIDNVLDEQWWEKISLKELEKVRSELRLLNRYIEDVGPRIPTHTNVDDEIISRTDHTVFYNETEKHNYRKEVESVLNELFDQIPAIQKIKSNSPVSNKELEELESAILSQNPNFNSEQLYVLFPEYKDDLYQCIRKIIGLDAKDVGKHFDDFRLKHGTLSSDQLRFLSMVENHIVKNGGVEIESLYQAPFTMIKSGGIDEVFTDDLILDEVFSLINNFQKNNTGAING